MHDTAIAKAVVRKDAGDLRFDRGDWSRVRQLASIRSLRPSTLFAAPVSAMRWATGSPRAVAIRDSSAVRLQLIATAAGSDSATPRTIAHLRNELKADDTAIGLASSRATAKVVIRPAISRPCSFPAIIKQRQ